MTSTGQPIDHLAAEHARPDRTAPRAAAGVLAAGGVLLLISLTVNPGPGPEHVHTAAYVPGHLLNGAAYLLLVLGLPVIPATAGRLGVLGAVGYAALVSRYVLSTGSQLFQAVVYPGLAGHPDLRAQVGAGGPLSSVYGRWDDQVSLVLAVGMLGLVVALWRIDRSLRGPALLLLLTAAADVVITPVALVAVSALAMWLGLRVAVGGHLFRSHATGRTETAHR